MEHHTLLRRCGEQKDGTTHLVDWRELIALAQSLVWHHSHHHVCPEQCQEVVCLEVDLKLAICLACGQVAHPHNLGIQTFVSDSIKYQFLSLIFRIYIFVLIDILSHPQSLLVEFHV